MTLHDLAEPGNLAKLSGEEKAMVLEHLAREVAKSKEKFARYFPDHDITDGQGQVLFHHRGHYQKHIAFFAAGATYETVCHATGRYPDWWEGKRFDHPIEAWACGTNSETLRDIVQSKLFGPWANVQQGNPLVGGMMPVEHILHHVRRPHGLPGSLETVWIRHVSGGTSTIGLKMYEQGRKSFEGTAKHLIWDDEEPDEGIYTEQLFRTATTKGIVMVTFTPLRPTEGRGQRVQGDDQCRVGRRASPGRAHQAAPHRDVTALPTRRAHEGPATARRRRHLPDR
jgi:phage terminase large subunit-like protein